MIVTFKECFRRDLRKIRDTALLNRVKDAIQEVEATTVISDIRNIKKLRGSESFFRIKIGDYRCGLSVDGDIVSFVRCLHRKDIYRFFPQS